MAWWDDLFGFNEAFASLMEGESLGALKPESGSPGARSSSAPRGRAGHRKSSLSASHPIHVPVASAEEANALFDDITYSKGAAVLHMLVLYLTPEKWKAGVHAYSHRPRAR